MAEGIFSGDKSSKSGSDEGPAAQRAAKLDKLMNKSDWAGVIAVASCHNQDDEREEQRPTRTKKWFGKQDRPVEQEEKGCSRPTWLTRLPECDIFCVFNLISQIRVVSRDALKVFYQHDANFAEPILDRKYISSLIKMLWFTNVHPCCKARQMFDRSDV